MNDDNIHQGASASHILMGGCCGLIAGVLLGAAGLLAWGIISGGVISVGFGLMGLFYLPIGGGIIGGIVGGIVGSILGAFV